MIYMSIYMYKYKIYWPIITSFKVNKQTKKCTTGILRTKTIKKRLSKMYHRVVFFFFKSSSENANIPYVHNCSYYLICI